MMTTIVFCIPRGFSVHCQLTHRHHVLLFWTSCVLIISASYLSQLFQTSKSPGRDSQKRGPSVIIAKPGSYHRPTNSAVPVIGGHRYWQGQTLHPDSGQARVETRSGRSPRRHSPGYKKAAQAAPRMPTNSSGLLGVSFSKLSNFKHLRARGDASQKKASENNKADR